MRLLLKISDQVLRSPAYVPEAVSTIQLMENFRRSNNSFALIVDEYGEVQGMVTLTDVLAALSVTIPVRKHG